MISIEDFDRKCLEAWRARAAELQKEADESKKLDEVPAKVNLGIECKCGGGLQWDRSVACTDTAKLFIGCPMCNASGHISFDPLWPAKVVFEEKPNMVPYCNDR